MHQKFDSVEVFKNPHALTLNPASRRGGALDFSGSSRLIRANELGHLLPIDLWRSEAQFFLERLLQDRDVPVFAENERDDKPIGPRADLAIIPKVSKKSLLTPARDVWRRPTIVFRFFVEGCSFMACISDRCFFSRADWLHCFADQHAGHEASTAWRKILHRELMFVG